MSNKDFIRLEKITKRYQEGGNTRSVLENASASFKEGEFTAVLGKSGSGKSTILNIISGIDFSESGQVWVGGQNLTAMADGERTLFRRSKIGFIFQFFNLIPTLTVFENVVLPMELSGADADQAKSRTDTLLAEVGLLDRAKTFPDRLSGGEQQRVAIARALVNNPMLVLADEPTGNLDSKTGESVLKLLDRLTRQAGKNLIMVTHSRGSAAYADRVLRLEAGQLKEEH
ncbi:MAG: ABC transporter ATP-binding protein [Chloroflexota bacterium]